MTNRSIATALLVMALGSALASSTAWAGQYIGYVTAESRYGNGTVRGLVRHGPYGLQVQTPGGTWLDCRRQGWISGRNRPCAETLRAQTVDFWETQNWNRGGNE